MPGNQFRNAGPKTVTRIAPSDELGNHGEREPGDGDHAVGRLAPAQGGDDAGEDAERDAEDERVEREEERALERGHEVVRDRAAVACSWRRSRRGQRRSASRRSAPAAAGRRRAAG